MCRCTPHKRTPFCGAPGCTLEDALRPMHPEPVAVYMVDELGDVPQALIDKLLAEKPPVTCTHVYQPSEGMLRARLYAGHAERQVITRCPLCNKTIGVTLALFTAITQLD